ncbi:MAG: shikimate dehydrogenase [Acidobacteriaceae bacterium]
MTARHPHRYEPRFLRLRLPRICVAVYGEDATELLHKAEQLAGDESFLEFRLDYLANPLAAIPRLKQFVESYRQITTIATCRRAVNGGRFKGSAAAQLDILLKAADAGFPMVDVEVETAEGWKPEEFERLRAKTAILISSHDFKQTKDLDGTFARIADPKLPADLIKIVATAKSLSDNVTMMRFLERNSDKQTLVGLCMGEQGIISRLLGFRAGSAFTFAAGFIGEETAPGQVTASTLRNVYRADLVDAATKVYGVVGDPVAHSLSPLMLNAAFRRENHNGVYLPLHAKKLDDLLRCVRELPIHGISVTMPYKQEIVEYLDKSDEITARIGACNTVVRSQEGKLYGFNTDVAGVVRPLEQRMNLQGVKVLVLGAGGAARAAVFGLKERGAEVTIYNRTSPKGQKLARQAGAKTIARGNLVKTQFDVIIHATPVGMDGKSALLESKELNAKYLFELIYTPAETPLVRLARAKGMQIISGSEMFVQQGARQFEIWTGKPAPLEEMHRVVLHALAQREHAGGEPAKPERAVKTEKAISATKAKTRTKATPKPKSKPSGKR